ncbi:MAG: hypothetical protein HYV26_10850 [Candidatus Hydrogenedentes bacterium]|nr:hypothetical protein [Candidatus Hydrogenedentota bacterium]
MSIMFLFAVSLALTGAAWRVKTKFEDRPPLAVSAGLFIGILLVLSGLVVPFAVSRSGGFDAIFWMQLAVVAAFPPVVIAGWQLAGSSADFFANLLFNPAIVNPSPNQFGRAKTKAVRGDFEGAMREYRLYFEQNPKCPTPLFAAAHYAAHKGEAGAATSLYHEIMTRFHDNRPIWAEAALFLANHAEVRLKDQKMADALLRDVLKRARNLRQARVAAECVLRRQMEHPADPPPEFFPQEAFETELPPQNT